MALNLACESIGSGSPMLVLHGLFGSGSNWRGVARHLAASHTVHCVDLRNHGASPWADSMAYAAMADDVLQLCDRLGLKAPAVMGHSMGGKTAMALALRHPQRVSRLIVVDIAPVSYADTLTPFAEAMRGVNVVAAATRAEVQARLSQAVPDPAVVPFLMQNLVMQNHHFDWRLNLLGISASMPGLCAFPSDLLGMRFNGPTTVIAGAQSDYVVDRDGASFAPMFGDVEIDVVENAGHWVHADQPTAFLARVRHALQRNAPHADLAPCTTR
ncbi:MAG: alpha/beta fold hydrolase [Burkholderiales bacterium]